MKKSIVTILILVIMASILVGCGNTSSTSTSESTEPVETVKEFSDYGERIEVIGTEYHGVFRVTYAYDTVLNVVYMYTYHQSGYSGGGSMMVVTDLNGVPVSYENFIAQYESIE